MRRPRPGPPIRVEADPLLTRCQIIKARGTWRRLGEPGFSLFATPYVAESICCPIASRAMAPSRLLMASTIMLCSLAARVLTVAGRWVSLRIASSLSFRRSSTST